ncbi:hypothetical protein DFH07DRAFT_80644 [Mycena maculata]|uniref:Uncharacterized protein n=1 Tax=Mycena maculata TaxID=230809 RepID=A0AAD7ICQ6_9AGAR|nr:hypothetical protein DFH07DRAFT_80644 [Mycena maculata]
MSLVSASTIPGYVLRYRSHAMDGVYSIVAGLAMRIVVDAATFHNVKLSGTLVGLWEGVVLLHYVNKAPSSSDPYLAYGVRLFVDFLFTESIFKLVVVLLWSTMGMVLADVAPAVWADSGLKRQWSRFRRDLTRSARMFSKRRTTTVRFVSAPTVVSTIRSAASTVSSVSSTSAFPASTTAPPSESPATPVAPSPPILIRRRSSVVVPGTFPGAEWSETETDAGTAVEQPAIPAHVTIARIIPSEASEDSYSFTTSPRSSSPAYSLDYSDDPSATNPVDIPSDMEEERTTPKQKIVMLPPTPSDSLQDWDASQHGAEEVQVPESPWMPLIPDHEPLEEWETVDAEEAPEAPPKDALLDIPAKEEDGDDSSIAAPSTIAPNPPAPMPIPDPIDDSDVLITFPIPEPAPPPEEQSAGVSPTEEPPAQDPPPTEDAAQNPPPTDEPPPSFEDLYGSEHDSAPPATAPSHPPSSRAPTPTPPSVKQALALRKEALVLNQRIADLARKRKTSLSDGAPAAAVLTALEITETKKELAEVNAKAEGAFVGAYNPPTASLYEFNTTGLTPEEAVRQRSRQRRRRRRTRRIRSTSLRETDLGVTTRETTTHYYQPTSYTCTYDPGSPYAGYRARCTSTL